MNKVPWGRKQRDQKISDFKAAHSLVGSRARDIARVLETTKAAVIGFYNRNLWDFRHHVIDGGEAAAITQRVATKKERSERDEEAKKRREDREMARIKMEAKVEKPQADAPAIEMPREPEKDSVLAESSPANPVSLFECEGCVWPVVGCDDGSSSLFCNEPKADRRYCSHHANVSRLKKDSASAEQSLLSTRLRKRSSLLVSHLKR